MVNKKYNIDLNKLHDTQISVLKRVEREGQKHLKYFYSTMDVFEFPDKRVKCHDTIWFEEVLPIIQDALKQL